MLNILIVTLHNCYKSIHSHFSGSSLDASVGNQSPVVALTGAERALPGFLVNLHLKRLHVCLIFLIGCKAYSWEGHSKHILSLLPFSIQLLLVTVSINVNLPFSNFSVVLHCCNLHNGITADHVVFLKHLSLACRLRYKHRTMNLMAFMIRCTIKKA